MGKLSRRSRKAAVSIGERFAEFEPKEAFVVVVAGIGGVYFVVIGITKFFVQGLLLGIACLVYVAVMMNFPLIIKTSSLGLAKVFDRPDDHYDWLTVSEGAALVGRGRSSVLAESFFRALPFQRRRGRMWYRKDLLESHYRRRELN